MKSVDKQYQELVKYIMKNGVEKGDRTGTGTVSTFAPPQMRFDLSKSFPLLSIKKTKFDLAFGELMWMMVDGSTNSNELSQKYGVNFWRHWADDNGDLPNIYGKQATRNQGVERVVSVDGIPIDGKVVSNYEVEDTNGDMSASTFELYMVWEEMFEIAKAHNTLISEEWGEFKNFLNQAKELKNYREFKRNPKGYTLSRNYFGGNMFSPNTSFWVSIRDNTIYNYAKYAYELTYPDGSTEMFIEKEKLERTLGTRVTEQMVIKGSGYKNYKVRRVVQGGGNKFYRYQLPVNQVQRVIDTIKENPNSRRMVIDNWNAYDLEYQALPSCHAFVQFYVSNGELSCFMYQRSQDLLLGSPYNISFYSLLTYMIAHVTGLGVGEFIYQSGDAHIYNNLISMAEEVLSREPREEPQLKIKRSVERLEDFTLEDFELIGYNPLPHIKGQVSV